MKPGEAGAAPAQVLVVDDEPANVRLVQAYLKAEGSACSARPAAPRPSSGGEGRGGPGPARHPHASHGRVRGLPSHPPEPGLRRMPVVFLTAEFNDADSELKASRRAPTSTCTSPSSAAPCGPGPNLIRLADAERDRRMATQLAQSEKLAAIGQIAAGRGPRDQQPAGLRPLQPELPQGLRGRRAAGRRRLPPLADEGLEPEERIGFQSRSVDSTLCQETSEGGRAGAAIVQELKTFSRGDEQLPEPVDLRGGLASTLLLTERELRRARVVKGLPSAPPVSMAQRGPSCTRWS